MSLHAYPLVMPFAEDVTMATNVKALPVEPAMEGVSAAIAVAAMLAATVLVVLDAVIANIALPTIAATLRITPAMSVRVVTTYQLALVMALLPCAALGE